MKVSNDTFLMKLKFTDIKIRYYSLLTIHNINSVISIFYYKYQKDR